MQKGCADLRAGARWSVDVIKDPGSFQLSASQSRHPKICPGSPWWLRVAARGNQSNVLPYILEGRGASCMSPSLPSNGAALFIWTLELLGVVGQVAMGSAKCGTSISMPGVPGKIPEPSQEIVRRGEVGKRA